MLRKPRRLEPPATDRPDVLADAATDW